MLHQRAYQSHEVQVEDALGMRARKYLRAKKSRHLKKKTTPNEEKMCSRKQ